MVGEPEDPVGAQDTLLPSRSLSSSSLPPLSLGRRESLVGISQSFTATSSYTNETFGRYLCDGLHAAAGTSAPIITLAVVVSGTSPGWYTLPECFYGNATTVTSFTLSTNMLAVGNDTYPDAMVRIGASLSRSATVFRAASAFLRDATGANSPVDWVNFFAIMPSITSLTITNMDAGTGSTLPSSIPATMSFFVVNAAGLSGTIPATFFSLFTGATLTTLYLDLSNNAFTGSIPSTFLGNLPIAQLTNLNWFLSGCGLSGSISPSLLGGSWTAMKVFNLEWSINAFSGPATNLLQNAVFTKGTFTGLSISMAGNDLTGSIPMWLSGGIGSSVTSLMVSFSNNLLTGSIPSNYFSNMGLGSMTYMTLSLEGNKLTGGLPSGLLNVSSSSALQLSWTGFALYLSNNLFDGSIAPDLFAPLNCTSTANFIFQVANNQFTGGLPTTLCGNNAGLVLNGINLNFGQNPKMTGSIPTTFWTSLIPTTTVTTAIKTYATLTFNSTPLTGALVFPDYRARTPILVTLFSAINSNFGSISFASGAEAGLSTMDLTGNTGLSGTLPSSLFNSSTSTLTSLIATNTKLTGLMPDMGTLKPSALTTLRLGSTLIDFCSGTRTTWASPSLSSCILSATSAYYCSSSYPASCTVSVPSPSTIQPAADPVAHPVGCSESTRPSPSFHCVGSTWTYEGTVNTTVLTIPVGATETVIVGNVTSASIVVSGFDSTLVIYGCATNLTSITVTLTAADLAKIGSSGKTQVLLSYGSNDSCSADSLGPVQISTKVTGSSCRKVSVTTSQSGGTLAGIFQVNSSACKVWWIILVSVVAGVVVIGTVAAVFIVKHVQKKHYARHSIKPKI